MPWYLWAVSIVVGIFILILACHGPNRPSADPYDY